MADSIVKLSVEDSSFNSKIKAATKAFAKFGDAVTKAGVDSFLKFARGAETAKVAFQNFNKALKANALIFVSSLAIEAGQAIGEMIGKWITGADDAESAQRKLNDELERTSDIVNNLLSDADFNARIAKAAGKSTSEVLKIKYDAANKAYVEAMSTLFDPKIKVGTDEYNKAREIFEKAEKAKTKAWQDIQVDETAKINRTGEYTQKGGRGSRTKVDTEARKIQRMMADLQNAERKASKILDEIRAKEHQTETMGTSGFNEQNIANWTSMMKDQLSKADFGSVMYNQIVENMKDMSVITELTKEAVKRGLNPNELGLTDLFEQAFDNIDVDDSVLQDILNKINTWFKDNPIELNVKTGEKGKNGIGNVTDDVKALTKAARTTADVVGSIGQAFNAIENPAAKIAAIVAEAIANVALGYAKALTMVKEAGGPWGWIAFAATGAATMLTSIAQIHSATGYAEGGIVRGNTYSNDQIFAGLNAGEVVLNRAQSGVLASQLDGNNGGFADGQIVGVLQGEHIALVAKRWGKRTGKGENVSFKIA